MDSIVNPLYLYIEIQNSQGVLIIETSLESWSQPCSSHQNIGRYVYCLSMFRRVIASQIHKQVV